MRVSYSGDVRFSTATQLPDMANSLEWATYFNLAQYNTNGSTAFNEETMANIVKYLNGEFTDPLHLNITVPQLDLTANGINTTMRLPIRTGSRNSTKRMYLQPSITSALAEVIIK